MNADYFGVGPAEIAKAGGYVTTVNSQEIPDFEAMRAGTDGWSKIGRAMISIAPLWRSTGEATRNLLIKLSFILGCLQLVLGHLRQMGRLLPDLKAIAELGWCLVLVSMLGVIWGLFFASQGPMVVSQTVIVAGIVIGLLLVILFNVPDRNPLKRMALGFASSLLPTIGTFGDTMSYIRLMAVGSASYYIALSFNSLAATVAASAGWFAASPILVFGHGLNIALGIIAIFAHGVRLNMLEFSNSVQVQWMGYAYSPFAKTEIKES
jgi:V/A-type H+-transporting ATPase subunit I